MKTPTPNKRLKNLRYNAGLTQMELAELAGVSQPTLSAIETGLAVGRPSTLTAIADALGCSVTDLLAADEVAS